MNAQVVEVTERKNKDRAVIFPVQNVVRELHQPGLQPETELPDDIIETITPTVGGEAINLAKEECKNCADLKPKFARLQATHNLVKEVHYVRQLHKPQVCDKTIQNYKIYMLSHVFKGRRMFANNKYCIELCRCDKVLLWKFVDSEDSSSEKSENYTSCSLQPSFVEECETDSQISSDPGEKFGYGRDKNWVAMEKEAAEEDFVMESETEQMDKLSKCDTR